MNELGIPQFILSSLLITMSAHSSADIVSFPGISIIALVNLSVIEARVLYPLSSGSSITKSMAKV